MSKEIPVEHKGEEFEEELQLLEWLNQDIDTETNPKAGKLARTLHTFDHYICVNQSSVPNYDYFYHNGELISSYLAESSVNQIVSRRIVKKQQIRWTKRGVHLLLQIQTRALNNPLIATPACRGARSSVELLWILWAKKELLKC